MDNTQQTEPWNRDPKKIRLIRNILIVALVVLGIVGGIVFYITYRKKTPAGTTTFPISENEANSKNNTGEEGVPTESGVIVPKLYRKIYPGNVAGYYVTKDETIRLFDKGKGVVTEINTQQNTQKNSTNQPILYIHDATFITDSIFIVRYLDNNNIIKSRLYSIEKNSDLNIGDPTLLADHIVELSANTSNKKVVLLIKTDNGSKVDLLDTETKKIETIITLPLSEWIPYISDNEQIFLSSKASHFAESGFYRVFGKKLQTLSKGEINKTSLPSPDGKRVIITGPNQSWGSHILELSYDKNKVMEESKRGPDIHMNTIAEKCAWNNDSTQVFCGVTKNDYPYTIDEWYLGKKYLKNSILMLDTTNLAYSTVDLETGNEESIDITLPTFASNHFYFVNKKDESLWEAIIPKTPLFEDDNPTGNE